MPDLNNQALHQFLTRRYVLEGLKTLCLYLEVDPDNLDGRTTDALARELIRYMVRVGRAGELVALQTQAEAALERRDAHRDVPAERLYKLAHDPRRVFISHAHEDAAFAHRLAADLERAGHPVWIAPESIQHGEEWVEAIGRGLEESAFFVVILTPAGVTSKWVKKEGNLAVEMEVDGQLAFIPLWHRDCTVPRVWRAYQRVPFDGRYEAGLTMLKGRLGIASPPPDRRTHAGTGIELIRIPAGPFLYGSADSDKMARDNEKPQRTIELPEYWIGRAPVTNAEFARFVKATGHRTTAEVEGKGIAWTGKQWEWVKDADWRHPGGPESSINGKDAHPAVQVSWDDAKAFCDWAGLALPTEEQWENAARGTDGRIWPWGNDAPTDQHCNFNRNVGDTTPVGKYSPKGDSPYGCADMAGNVWEWTGSWYTEGETRALRGGAWDDGVQYTRAAYRDAFNPHFGYNVIGFRVVELLSDPAS